MGISVAAAFVVVSEGLIGWVRLISFGLVGRELFEKSSLPCPHTKTLLIYELMYVAVLRYPKLAREPSALNELPIGMKCDKSHELAIAMNCTFGA